MSNKKVLFVIAFEGFRDEEYAEPKRILTDNGIQVVTASTGSGTARGKLGMEATVDCTYDTQRASDYDAVVFIGGPGSPGYWDDPKAHALLQDAAAAGKVIGSICSAGVTLAKAGVLRDKRATVWAGDGDVFRPLVGEYTEAAVEVDGRCVTGNGPRSAQDFGQALLKALNA